MAVAAKALGANAESWACRGGPGTSPACMSPEKQEGREGFVEGAAPQAEVTMDKAYRAAIKKRRGETAEVSVLLLAPSREVVLFGDPVSGRFVLLRGAEAS